MQKYYKKLLIVFVVMTVLLSGVGAEPTDGDSVYMGSSRYEYQGGKWIPVSGPDAQGTGGNSGSDSSSDYDDSSAREAYAQAHSAAETELSIDASTNTSVGTAVNSIDSVENINIQFEDPYLQHYVETGMSIANLFAGLTEKKIKNGEAAINIQAISEAPSTADPVRYSTGEYIQTDTDLSLNWGITDFVISRNYGIRNCLTGTTGFGWENSLDQRLIIGTNNDAWEAVNIQKSYVEYLESTRDSISKTICMRYKVNSVNTAYAEIESRLNTCRAYQQRAKKALSDAENHKSYGSSFSDLQSLADTNYRNAQIN